MPKLRESAPKSAIARSLRCAQSGGSIDVTAMAEGTSVRPGSWNGAKARDGSPEDLRDPIRVHVTRAGNRGGRLIKRPGLEDVPPNFQERCGEHERGGYPWAVEANQ